LHDRVEPRERRDIARVGLDDELQLQQLLDLLRIECDLAFTEVIDDLEGASTVHGLLRRRWAISKRSAATGSVSVVTTTGAAAGFDRARSSAANTWRSSRVLPRQAQTSWMPATPAARRPSTGHQWRPLRSVTATGAIAPGNSAATAASRLRERTATIGHAISGSSTVARALAIAVATSLASAGSAMLTRIAAFGAQVPIGMITTESSPGRSSC
jgi:hypothetical protein